MIEVGEYVRTKSGKFDKVINNNYYMPQYIECEKSIVNKENIVKHSKNIIDLIEVGDWVNGKRIHKIDRGKNYCYLYYGNCKTFVDYQIKTILTKELYQANCYTVERKEE